MSSLSYERPDTWPADYPGGIYPRIEEPKRSPKAPVTVRSNKPSASKKKPSDAARRFFTVLVVLLSVTLLLEVVFHLLVSPRLRIEHIHIHTGSGVAVTEEEVLRAAGIESRLFYYDVNTEEIAQRLMSLPFVQRAEVQRIFPDSLSVSLIQREAVAVLLLEDGGETLPALVDREGVVYRIGGEEIHDLPLVSGIRFEAPRLGMRLPEVLKQFLEDLERIKQTSPVLLTLISEFKFIKKDGDRYEVMIYPEHYRLPVRIGDRLDERSLNYIMMVLDVVLRQGMTTELREIDFRGGDVAFRTREG
ncbi:MAG: FtsQ-type POTRA domain-containing protein [Spirochaetales bacterium]|nr:FtsQ-type POTRA domain-containing protein [Spirochaetales bacterium]